MMACLVVILRFIISIQIISIVAFSWDLINHYKIEICGSKVLPSGGPNYTIGQPVFTWKLWPGTSGWVTYESFLNSLPQFGAPWLEYYIISQRLGYGFRLKESNESFFRCPDDDSSCNFYRHFVPYRISNYEDAETHFTDYIPGHEHITYKANLVSHGGRYIPKAFHIPEKTEQFKQYIDSPWNQKKHWIQKDPAHRGNVVKEVKELDFSLPSLIQKFISNPFLIDGRKFSIGVHVAFPSAKPLRAYVYDSTVELRFCPLDYDPTDFTKSRSYVCDGMEQGVHFVRQMKSLRDFSMQQEYSTKQSLDAYIDSVGGNSSSVTSQIRDAIRDVLDSRKDLFAAQNEFTDTRSRHFQWTRWDFLLDEKFNIHLVEVNINPSLHCTAVTPDQLHPQFCNNIAYNLFRVLGIASHYDFHKRSIHYVVRDGDVYVESNLCYTPECHCQIKECQVCSKCLTDNQRDSLKSVLWEHFTQGQTRLVYPYLTDDQSGTFDTSDDNHLTKEWLRLKCTKDIQWCNFD